MTKKIKLLAWSDSATAGTGFGTVSRHVLTALYNTGKYEIHHLAINFHGDFLDKKEIPWQVQPAKLSGPQDPHGIRMFIRTLIKNEYDLVWVCNDLFVTHQAAEAIQKAKEKLYNEGKTIPKFVYYYPVDCSVPEEACNFLKICDIPVCYTKHGREETLKTLPKIGESLSEIPHGVDTSSFFPMSLEEIAFHKENLFKIDPSVTMVLNVNRNSTRKQIQYSLVAFREFRKRVPNSIMYLHTAVKDQGGNLIKAIQELGLDPRKDIVFPTKFSPSNPVNIETLNAIYNCGDIFLTTHLGEGWGLTVTESMAAGTPVVAPNNTAMPQQLGENSSRGYLYPCNDIAWIDSSGYREKGLIPDIVHQMMKAYNDGSKKENKKVQAALKWTEKHSWANITKAWIQLFEINTGTVKKKENSILGEEI